ncbi:MAG: OmpA family protein [Gammaproteobacteria bacterium]
MNNSTPKLVFISVLLIAISGCASQPGRTSSGTNPFCTLVGAGIGGGGAAAITAAAGPIGAGAFVGAMLGTLACHTGEPEPEQVAASPPPPPPPAPAREPDRDSDGDGVVDRLDRCPDTPRGKEVDVHGCPDVLLVLTGVNFKHDSSVIEPASAQILNRAVEALKKANSVNVRIVGHTDSSGTNAYNRKLSQRRADAVRDYLIQHGINGSRLTTEGMGEERPVASNSTKEGRFENRRVEFHVDRSGSNSR